MNTIVEYEAQELTSLFNQGDMLSVRMFMENMNMPLDVQDKICDDVALLRRREQHDIEKVIESHSYTTMTERLNY